jgi:hypothetical protein
MFHLVDASQGRDVDGLTTDSSGATDTGRVFAGSRVDDGVDQHLQWVLGKQKDFNNKLISIKNMFPFLLSFFSVRRFYFT